MKTNKLMFNRFHDAYWIFEHEFKDTFGHYCNDLLKKNIGVMSIFMLLWYKSTLTTIWVLFIIEYEEYLNIRQHVHKKVLYYGISIRIDAKFLE